MLLYPSQHDIHKLSQDEIQLKIARHSPCSFCACAGLHPPVSTTVGLKEEDEVATRYTLLDQCECGHGVSDHGNDHNIPSHEQLRRAKVAIRLDELLQESHKLLDFEYIDDDILSLRKQMQIISDGSTPNTLSPKSMLSPLSAVELDEPLASRRDSPMLPQSDDEDEDRPLASRIPQPAPRIGKTIGGRLSMVSQHPGGSHQAKLERMSAAHLDRLATGVTVDSSAPLSARPEKPCITELRQGLIQVVPVYPDGQSKSLVILTGLKTLFQKQLPKMPREYISRLVYDHNSRALAIVKNGWKVVGGILYRPFAHRGFAEIVFLATASIDQIKGYGGMLMNHFKMHIKQTYPSMMHFLTYADNYAVGYFRKQGFSKDITLDRSVWAGYIKDYEGATILQCSMLPQVDYARTREILNEQREAILTRIRENSTSHIIHPGIDLVSSHLGENELLIDPGDVPGLSETGWNPSMAQQAVTHSVNPNQVIMHQLLSSLQNHPQSWAFLQPVNGEEVTDYYEVVKKPMDFNTMEHKLTHGLYDNIDDFVDDARLVFHNCLLYNPEGSVYAKNAVKMQAYLEEQLAALLPSIT